MAALKGLSPVTVLSNTAEGRAALAANRAVTNGIQTGQVRQPTLLPFGDQRQQALKDAFITSDNLAQLADGLGTALGSAFLARFHTIDRSHSTSLPPAVAKIVNYSQSISGANSGAGKFFFANGTKDGKTPVSTEAQDILTKINGHTDFFGTNYGFPAGAAGANPFGNSRPFQTSPVFEQFVALDYLNAWTTNVDYNRGPIMNLVNSPSFPSGHTTYGYTGVLTLAILVPDRYQQMIARGAEYGNDRILMGAHYTMDVLGGRTVAMYDMAHLLANDPLYVSKEMPDFRAAMISARDELTKALEAASGSTIATCATADIGRFSNAGLNGAFYACTQTYGLPTVYSQIAASPEDVGKLAPEAGYLLTVAFPKLTMDEANRILTETEGSGGGFLDDGSSFGVYSRIDLYTAAGRAAQMVQGR